ncbi:hypothetical protein D9M72_649860 [compost metagenome]
MKEAIRNILRHVVDPRDKALKITRIASLLERYKQRRMKDLDRDALWHEPAGARLNDLLDVTLINWFIKHVCSPLTEGIAASGCVK